MLPTQQPLGSTRLFNVSQFSVAGTYVGGLSSYSLPCTAGDTVTLTGTLRYISGAARPVLGIWFWDATQTVNYGAVQLSPPNTDNGWHVMTVTVKVPAGATLMVVATIAESLFIDLTSYFVGFVTTDTNGPYGPSLGIPANLVWEISDYRITQNGIALYAPIDTPSGGEVFGSIQLSSWFGGTGYLVNDDIFILQPGASGGRYVVVSVDGFGSPLSVSVAGGQGYSVTPGFDLFTTGGSGSGLMVKVVAVQNVILPAPPILLLQEFVYPLYYLSLFSSQYQQSPIFYAWAAALLTPTVDLLACTLQMYQHFDVSTALGLQLDELGSIVGASRTLSFQPSGGASATLSDADYIILIQAKIAQNHWDGQINSIYALWNSLFPSAALRFIDNQNMTCTIILAGVFSSVQQDMLTHGLILPRPEGVQYNFTFAALPILGFDQINANIAGFDAGHFA